MDKQIRVLTLWQPWASWIGIVKHHETRSWHTNYRGLLIIHAAKRPIDTLGQRLQSEMLHRTGSNPALQQKLMDLKYPLGEVVSVCELTDCLAMADGAFDPGVIALNSVDDIEKAAGDWSIGRYAWKLENNLILPRSIPYKGGQGLRKPDADLVGAIGSVLGFPIENITQ
jgi:hypothetical protein